MQRMPVNPSADRHKHSTANLYKARANGGITEPARCGIGNADIQRRRCAAVGPVGREAGPQGREVVQEGRLRSGAALAGTRAAYRCDQPRRIRRGRAGHCTDARMAPGQARRALQEVREVRYGQVSHWAAASCSPLGAPASGSMNEYQGIPVMASISCARALEAPRSPRRRRETYAREHLSFCDRLRSVSFFSVIQRSKSVMRPMYARRTINCKPLCT